MRSTLLRRPPPVPPPVDGDDGDDNNNDDDDDDDNDDDDDDDDDADDDDDDNTPSDPEYTDDAVAIFSEFAKSDILFLVILSSELNLNISRKYFELLKDRRNKRNAI